MGLLQRIKCFLDGKWNWFYLILFEQLVVKTALKNKLYLHNHTANQTALPNSSISC